MTENLTPIEALHSLRLIYEKETSAKRAYYEAKIAEVDKKTKEVKGKDFCAPYRAELNKLFSSVEKKAKEIDRIEGETHGIRLRLLSLCKTAKPYIDFSSRESCVALQDNLTRMAEEARAISDLFGKSNQKEDFERLTERFASFYRTAQYLSSNADGVLSRSGIPEGKRSEELKALAAERDELVRAQVEALTTENLDCYPTYTEVLDRYKTNYARVSEDIIGAENERMYFDTDYRYLIGFYEEDIPAPDRRFAEDVLGLTPAELSCSPIYFEPEKGFSNIVINGNMKDFESELYRGFVCDLYLSIAHRMAANCLKYSAIACNPSTNGMFVSDLENYVKGLSTANVYLANEVVRDESSARRVIDTLRQSSLHFRTSDNSSIYEFNRTSSVDRMPFHLTYVDCYPVGLGKDPTAIASLEQLMKEGKRSGFFTVLSHAKDAVVSQGYNAPAIPDFSDAGEKYNALEIDITAGKVRVGGRPARLTVTAPDFDSAERNEYWKKLGDHFNKKEIFHLEKLFRDLDAKKRTESNGESAIISGKMAIPLGYVGNDIYELKLDLNSACHTVILGDSGAGKTSFMHTFIMSAAYKYSPDELQFYLADWKMVEFETYKRNPLPHVHYLQNSSSIPEYLSLLRMVRRMYNRRNRLFKRTGGVSGFLEYNRLVEKEKRMPFVMFIIDECHAMLEDGRADSGFKRETAAWIQLMSSNLALFRNAGIGIVLCSQSFKDFDIGLNNVPNRIILGQTQEDFLKSVCYKNSSDDQNSYNADRQYLSIRKSGHVVVGSAHSSHTERFRSAFSSEGAVRSGYARAVKEKWSDYECKMILGGSRELFPILSPTQPSYDTILNKVALPVSNNVNRRRTVNYDDTAYPVYIGVTSDDSTPIPMSFNTKGTGYCVYTANTERLSNITMNTILSFLYKTTAYKGEYDTKRVFYFGRDDSYDADLGFLINPPPKEEQDVYDEYGDEYSEGDADPAFAPKTFLKRYVSSHNVFNDAKDALDALLELYELYGKRRELGYERTEDYPPLLVVLRDLEWLKNLSVTVRKCNESGNAARTATYDSIEDDPLYMEILKELEEQREYYPSEAQMRSAARRFYAKRKSSGEEQPKAEKKAYSENEIIKALQTLYQQGAGCRIFTVIASDAKSEFELLTKPPYSLGKSEELSRYVIFGDSSENEDGLFKGDDHYSGRPETCIIYPTPKSNDPDEQEQERKFQSTDMGTLTRLYLFNASADEEWWEKLENRLNGV